MNVFFLRRFAYMSCFHTLEILNCTIHSHFSKSQLSSPTVYLLGSWELFSSIGNEKQCLFSTSTNGIVIGLTRIPNLFLHQGTLVVHSYCGAVVPTNCYWQ